MNRSIPVHATIANRRWMESLFLKNAQTRTVRQTVRAVWTFHGAAHDLGTLASFNGTTSFSGTHAVISVAWPDMKNPRTGGNWWRLLVPDDAARVTVYLACHAGTDTMEAPLMMGIPMPDGASESYGGTRETIDIRLEDITGPAARIRNYPIPFAAADTVGAATAASAALGAIPFRCNYPLLPIDSCLERFPNALMAADNALIAQQDRLNPVIGRKRIRYGDRDGKIIYRYLENPDIGAPFNRLFPSSAFDFEYTAADIMGGLTVDPRYVRFNATRLNPYLDVGSRIKISFPRAGLGEVVEIHELGWRMNPGDEAMALKCRRQYTY